MSTMHMIYGKFYYHWDKECREKTGWTMKAIKEACKDKLQRYPRPGREVFVGLTKDEFGSIWLANRSGTLEVRVGSRPNSHPDVFYVGGKIRGQ